MKKIKKFALTNFEKILKILILIFLILVVILLIFPVNNLQLIDYNNLQLEPTEFLKKNSVIKQEFTSNTNKFDGICFRLSTYAIANKSGKIKIELYNQSNNRIFSKEQNLSEIVDNETKCYNIPLQKNSINNKYQFTINFVEYDDSISLVLWRGKGNADSEKKEINFSLMGMKKDFTYVWYPAFTASFLLLILISYKNEKGGEISEKKEIY